MNDYIEQFLDDALADLEGALDGTFESETDGGSELDETDGRVDYGYLYLKSYTHESGLKIKFNRPVLAAYGSQAIEWQDDVERKVFDLDAAAEIMAQAPAGLLDIKNPYFNGTAARQRAERDAARKLAAKTAYAEAMARVEAFMKGGA